MRVVARTVIVVMQARMKYDDRNTAAVERPVVARVVGFPGKGNFQIGHHVSAADPLAEIAGCSSSGNL